MAPIFLIISFYLSGVFSEKNISEPYLTYAELYPGHYQYGLGDEVTLDCQISNLGDYNNVTWRRDEDVITPNDRFEFEYESRERRLGQFEKTELDEFERRELEEEIVYSKNLVMKDMQAEDAGNYTCQLETDPPETISMVVEFINATILSTNQTFKAKVGDTVVLPCEVKELGDVYKVIWMKKNPDDSHIATLETKSSIFNSVRGRFRISNLNINNSDDQFLLISTAYSINNGDKNMKIIAGNSLEIRNLNTDNSGTYLCSPRILFNINEKYNQAASHELVVDKTIIEIPPGVEPTFIRNGYKHRIAVKDKARLPCEIANLGNHSVTWKKGEEVITFNDRVYLHEYQDTEKEKYDLIIDSISLEDAGNYTCEINTEPPKSITQTLMVLEPQILTANQTIKVAVGKTVILPCDVKDFGDTSVLMWTKEGEKDPIYLSMKDNPLLHKSGSLGPVHWDLTNLKIENFTSEKAGLYLCSIRRRNLSLPPNAIIALKLEVYEKKNVLDIDHVVIRNKV